MIYTIYIIMIADYTYVGSTRDLKQRKKSHKQCFFNPNSQGYNKKLYQAIRENGGWNAVDLKPIEEFECETTVHARIREEHWRREYAATLNMIRAHRTEEERRQYNRECTAEYRAANREALIQHLCEKIQCECGTTISRRAKSEHLRTKRHAERLAEQQNIMLL